VRQFEPFAPAMISDVMGLVPRGEAAPGNHPLSMRVASVAAAFGLPAFRVHLDPEATVVSFVAADGVALLVGMRLANAAGPARVAFDAARLFAFVVEHQTLAAVTDGNQLAAILSSLSPAVRSPELEKVKARLGRVLPRKARKELERLVTDPSVLNATPAYWADAHRRADRAALLTTGDPVTALVALAGTGDLNVIRRTARCHDLMNWLLSDEAWTVLAAFARSTPSSPPPAPRR
jgi:hypothetical protein